MKLFTMYKSILIVFAGLFLLSCSETKETPSVVVEVPEADRTVLVYMVGENSLSKFCSRNIDSIASGLQNVAVPVNMLVFEDSYSNTGTLWKIGKEDGVVVKDIVKEYGSVNSVDIDQMASIINDIYKLYPSSEKGLVLWSHATAWLPSPDYYPANKMSRSFGQDVNKYMEIWDLREALEKVPHLDFLIFDACHMASAEVAYELKDAADYIIASATEVMGSGFPYHTITPYFNKQKVDLEAVCKAYADYYSGLNGRQSGTISLIKTEGMEQLAKTYRAVFEENASRFGDIQASSIQQFGRFIGSSSDFRDTFYDMEQVVETVNGAAQSAAPANFKQALRDVILYEAHSPYFLGITLTRNCGLTIFVPEISSNDNYKNAYQELRWYERTRN